MCLSNVYKGDPADDCLLYHNIAEMSVEGDELVLTDIMGVRTRLRALVKKIDLLENYIVVEPV